MKALTLILLFTLIYISCTGCGSIMARSKPANNTSRESLTHAKYLYPGVEYDVKGIGAALSANHDCNNRELVAVFHIVNTPLSAIVDTVLLPYDAYMLTFGNQTRNGTQKQ